MQIQELIATCYLEELGFELSDGRFWFRDSDVEIHRMVDYVLPVVRKAWRSVVRTNLVSSQDLSLVLDDIVARNTLFHLVHCILAMSKISQDLERIKVVLDNGYKRAYLLEEEEKKKNKDFQLKSKQENEDMFKQYLDELMDCNTESENLNERRFLCPRCSLKFLKTIDLTCCPQKDLSMLDNFLYLIEEELFKSIKPPPIQEASTNIIFVIALILKEIIPQSHECDDDVETLSGDDDDVETLSGDDDDDDDDLVKSQCCIQCNQSLNLSMDLEGLKAISQIINGGYSRDFSFCKVLDNLFKMKTDSVERYVVDNRVTEVVAFILEGVNLLKDEIIQKEALIHMLLDQAQLSSTLKSRIPGLLSLCEQELMRSQKSLSTQLKGSIQYLSDADVEMYIVFRDVIRALKLRQREMII